MTTVGKQEEGHDVSGVACVEKEEGGRAASGWLFSLLNSSCHELEISD